jgi:esterase/lipase superfamily enzyme
VLPAQGLYQACVLFAWPSDVVDPDSILALLAVEESAADLADVLAALIDGLRPEGGTPGAALSIVAHGLGAYLIQKAAVQLRDGSARAPLEGSLHRLVLAAPDTDDDLFSPESAKDPAEGRALARLAERVCVLYSPEDAVLSRATALRPLHRPRMGLRGAADPSRLPGNVVQTEVGGGHTACFDSPRAVTRLWEALVCGLSRFPAMHEDPPGH